MKIKKGEIIYPGAIREKLKMDSESIYRKLLEFTKENYLETNYEMACFKCGRVFGLIYQTISSIPCSWSCTGCRKEYDPLKGTIMIFKALKDFEIVEG